MSKTLLFRIDTEIDSLVVAIPWTDETVELINRRREAVASLAAADNSFHRASFFWYGMEVYTMTDELEELLDYDDGGMAFVADPPLDESKRERIDVCTMGVDDKDVIFKFYLKHTNDELETPTVAFKDEEFFTKSS